MVTRPFDTVFGSRIFSMFIVGSGGHVEWSGDQLRAPELIWSGLKIIFGIFAFFKKKRKCSVYAPEVM